MNEKLAVVDLEDHLKQKVNNISFTDLANQVSTIKTQVNKFIYSEFEGFRTRIKIELSHKANEAEDDQNNLMNNEKIISLESKINTLEQQFKNIMMVGDDMLEDDEDYDSEEEMDNMNEDDLVRALMKDKKKEDGEAELPTIGGLK